MGKLLGDVARKPLRFVKNHQDIVISTADKGNVTVAMRNNGYTAQNAGLLDDRATSESLRADRVHQIKTKSNFSPKTTETSRRHRRGGKSGVHY